MVKVSMPGPGNPLLVVENDGPGGLNSIAECGVIELYKTYGALLFRGFDADLPQFRAFCRGFCKTAVINDSPNRELLDPDNVIQSVDGGDQAFPLHPELSREPWKPDVAFFACLSAPTEGGRTTICDGTEMVRAMPADLRRALEGRRLIHLMATWPDLFEFWLGTPEPDAALLANPPASCPYTFPSLPDGRVVRMFTRPALHKPMFCPGPAFGNFLLFARFKNGRENFPLLDDLTPVPADWMYAIRDIGDRLSIAVEWRKGDVLMIDNTRFMHGRQAITDVAERRIATFFGYLDFAVPNPEEPENPVWRQRDFAAPLHPQLLNLQ